MHALRQAHGGAERAVSEKRWLGTVAARQSAGRFAQADGARCIAENRGRYLPVITHCRLHRRGASGLGVPCAWGYSKAEIVTGEIMIGRLLAILWASCVLTGTARAAECSESGAEKYIRDSESAWAESVSTNDSSVVQRILADDFVWVYPDGTVKNKQQAVADAAGGPWGFLSDHLDEVRIRFYGNTAVAQGSETWVRKQADGTTAQKRFVWTDTWACREGNWQIVSAEDLIAAAKP